MLVVHEACNGAVRAADMCCCAVTSLSLLLQVVAAAFALDAESSRCRCCNRGGVVVTGGEEEAIAAYDEAMQAIFGLQLDRYCHVQPHRHPENNTMRWECIEMWPLQVPLQLRCTAKFNY